MGTQTVGLREWHDAQASGDPEPAGQTNKFVNWNECFFAQIEWKMCSRSREFAWTTVSGPPGRPKVENDAGISLAPR